MSPQSRTISPDLDRFEGYPLKAGHFDPGNAGVLAGQLTLADFETDVAWMERSLRSVIQVIPKQR